MTWKFITGSDVLGHVGEFSLLFDESRLFVTTVIDLQ